jgi:hypothetical protein
MFIMLVVLDFMAQLASSAGIVELQGLIGIWLGPLDDIFYGLAGVQALYFMIDPEGHTRDAVAVDNSTQATTMTTTATVKKIVRLLGEERHRRANLPRAFFTGSVRAVALLGDALILAVVANGLTSSLGVGAVMLVLQRHLSYLLPIALIVAAALLWAADSRPQRIWSLVMLAGFAALLVSMVADGRWSHHVHHLLAALSSLQAWGAALCWMAAGSCLPVPWLRVQPVESQPA